MTSPASILAAHFGAEPLFTDRVRPIGQLSAPPLARFFEIVRRRWDGIPCETGIIEELEESLAQLHGVSHAITCSNACIGLMAVIELCARRPAGEIILPAFTYVGLPHLVQWSGHRPRFCDVSESTHALDPQAVRAALSDETAMVLGVHQVNAPCAVDELAALSEEFGVPVVFDGVHGLYCTHRGVPIGGFGVAEVFSLHATKMLNGFEGGYITTHDEALARALRELLRHGSTADGLGMNGRLSEVHAAFALAGLEGLPAACERNLARLERYRDRLSDVPGLKVFAYPEDAERYNYEFTLVEVLPDYGLSRDDVVRLLLAEGTRARAYYSPPVHQTEHRPPEQSEPPLRVTEALAERFIQMPVGEHVSLDDIDAICERLRLWHQNHHDLASALASEKGP